MRKMLTTTALTLALLVAGNGWAQAQSSGGGSSSGSSTSGGSAGSGSSDQGASTGSSNDQGGTTGMMTTTPQSKSDAAAGTQGTSMDKEDCAPGQTPAAGQKC